MRVVLRSKIKFQKYARRLVSAAFAFFIGFMKITGIVELRVKDKHYFKNIFSKIIVANHPSLLDVVILLSLIPNADCVVRGKLSRSIVGGVVRSIYILNSLDFDELALSCAASLKQGYCLIIFPEGTRTRRFGDKKLKRGAAHLSLSSFCNIVPVHIGGNSKFGLGKHDPFFSFNPHEKYIYEIEARGEISPQRYASIPRPIAARNLTADIQASLETPNKS
jgi:1-acyl-sn-glycerol-3-phosphate acyltransferase